MGGKQMEGDNRERRKKAKEARKEGKAPSEEHVTTGGSKQREHLGEEEHREKVENIREGKHDVIRENTPEPRPGYGGEDD
ncbi:MAG: hypothetical protein ACLFRX_04485 [Gemmatimonadota bacterium]